MENQKLFAIDLDGTALLNFNTLHPKTIEGIKKVTELGHLVIIATGRNECFCINFYNQLGLDTPIVSSNGAVLNNPKDPSFKGWNKCVKQELVDYVISDEIAPYLDNMYYYANNKIYIHSYHEMLLEKMRMTGCEVEITPVGAVKNINSIALIVGNHNVEDLRSIIKAKFPEQDFNSWDGAYHESFIEVNPDDSNKWIAVSEVAKHYNISAENIYTFGDANNDYTMIKECENGVAMKNATNKLKSVADYVMDLTNEEGAVGEFMLNME